MRFFTLFLLITLFSVSCQSDSKESVNDGAPTAEPAETSTATTSTPATEEAPKSATMSNTSTPVTRDQFTLIVGEKEAKSGEQVCLDVSAANFREMISMQYSFRWKPELLTFEKVQNFQLPGLRESNFGTHRIAEGILTFVWIKEDLKGVDVKDGDALFQLCFTANGNAGEAATVRIWDSPTAFEAVNEREELMPFNTEKGKVVIK
mgnify:CR=1 FL=1